MWGAAPASTTTCPVEPALLRAAGLTAATPQCLRAQHKLCISRFAAGMEQQLASFGRTQPWRPPAVVIMLAGMARSRLALPWSRQWCHQRVVCASCCSAGLVAGLMLWEAPLHWTFFFFFLLSSGAGIAWHDAAICTGV